MFGGGGYQVPFLTIQAFRWCLAGPLCEDLGKIGSNRRFQGSGHTVTFTRSFLMLILAEENIDCSSCDIVCTLKAGLLSIKLPEYGYIVEKAFTDYSSSILIQVP